MSVRNPAFGGKSVVREFFSRARTRLFHPLERRVSIVAPKPEKTSATLMQAVEKGKIVQGDVLTYKTTYRPEETRGVYLGPVITTTDKGRLHLFTEEEPEREQTIITEGSLVDWKRVGHRSGHWDQLLKTHLGHNLSTKPLF